MSPQSVMNNYITNIDQTCCRQIDHLNFGQQPHLPSLWTGD